METEPRNKRHSLLPQRSASSGSASPTEPSDSTKLAAPSTAVSQRNREVSPSKLPVGGSRRGQTMTTRQPASHSHSQSQSQSQLKGSTLRTQPTPTGSTSASSRPDRAPSETGTRPVAAADQTNPRRLALAKGASSVNMHSATRLEPLSRLNKAPLKIASSGTIGKAVPSPSSPVREPKPATTRVMANVKVQRPAATTSPTASVGQRLTSPRKTGARQALAPSINKYALLSSQTNSIQKPAQDLKFELLHLHILHKNSAETQAQWTASAKAQYQKSFLRLVNMEDELRTAEIDFLEQRNAAALIGWCREVSSATGESKTKALSGVLDQMWTLLAPGGRYTAAVAAFEDWYAIMERSHDLRKLGHERQHVDVMEGLGDGWKNEIEGMMNALCVMSDALEGLGPAVEPSDLARCLNVLMTLLANMLDELMLIRDIEEKLVVRENSWVKGRISGISAQVSGDI